MRLAELLQELPEVRLEGSADAVFDRLAYRADKAHPSALFALFEEFLAYNRWGHSRDQLAACVPQPAALLTDQPVELFAGPQLISSNVRRDLGLIARKLHGSPDQRLPVVAVTGTNGKTTTTRLLGFLFHRVLGSGGSLGTLGMDWNGKAMESGSYTTPLAPDLFPLLAQFADLKTKAVAMEVSSHAMALQRVSSLRFAAAATARITRDHLDFHGSLESYIAAKRSLFEGLDGRAFAVLNRDCPIAWSFAECASGRLISYSCHAQGGADLVADRIAVSSEDTRFDLVWKGRSLPVRARLIGRFQVENILAALSVIAGMELPMEAAIDALADFEIVPGRMESIALPNGSTAVVDYAHNPDGLHNLLENCRALNPERIILVFGCGGDRDRGKRPLMGELAFRGADRVWVTSDNPRTEAPERIIADILEGIPAKERVTVEPDRRIAILNAYAETSNGDLLVVAGKGHEDYQLIGTTKYPFSDKAVLLSLC